MLGVPDPKVRKNVNRSLPCQGPTTRSRS
jgi:hypothetical protein